MMQRGNPTRQRLAALAFLGAPLLTYPLLGVPEGDVGGVPSIFIYLFGVWAGLIGLAAWAAERR